MAASQASTVASFQSPSERATHVVSASPLEAELARAVGSAVHLELAKLAPRAMTESVAAETRAVLARFESSALSKRLAGLEVIGREITIVHTDASGALWRGSIDLLAREPDGTLIVIDYKTDAELSGAAVRHTDQLSVYVEAVRRAIPGRSRAELWMLRHGEIVPID